MHGGRFERMFALPEREYIQLKSLYQTNNPTMSHFTTLAQDYHKQDAIRDPYMRIQRQGETLEEIKQLKEDLRKHITNTTPKPYQGRAESLMRFIEDKIDFNEKGELRDSSGTPILGSNATDLIQHAVRDRRRNFTPIGWHKFRERLQDSNAPHMLLNYDTLDEMKNINKPLSSISKASSLPQIKSGRKRKIPIKSPKREPLTKRERKKVERYMHDRKYL